MKYSVAGLDPGLFGNAGVVALAVAHAAADLADTDREAEAGALLFAVVGAGVLQAFELEIAAHLGDDLIALGDGALERRIAARLEGQGLSGRYMRVGPGEIRPVGVAASHTGADVDEEAVGANREADAGAARFVRAASGRVNLQVDT